VRQSNDPQVISLQELFFLGTAFANYLPSVKKDDISGEVTLQQNRIKLMADNTNNSLARRLPVRPKEQEHTHK
jgi:hypothetical protein